MTLISAIWRFMSYYTIAINKACRRNKIAPCQKSRLPWNWEIFTWFDAAYSIDASSSEMREAQQKIGGIID